MLLFFIVLHRYCVFDFFFFLYKIESLWQPFIEQVYWWGFYNICLFVSLFHILVVFKILQILLLYLWWCSVLSDL